MICKKSFFKFLLSRKSIFTKNYFSLFLVFSFSGEVFSKENKPSVAATNSLNSFSGEVFSKEKKLSGSFKKPLKSYTMGSNDLMRTDQKIFPEDAEIKFLIEEYLRYREETKKNLCPAGYKPASYHRLSGNTYFNSVRKNSCPKKQRAELYRISRKLCVKKINANHLMEAYKTGLTWTLNVFVYPFYPSLGQLRHFVNFDPKSFPDYKMFDEPPPEYKKYNIDKSLS